MRFIYSTATTLIGHFATFEHSRDWLFDIRLHAMEMTDVGGVSLYDPQAGEWDFGLEDWP